MTKKPQLLLAIAAFSVLVSPVVFAQSNDTLMLMNRLNDMDTQIQSLSHQVYRNGNAPSSSSSNSSTVSSAPVSSGATADLDIRVGRLEDQIRQLNGQLESQSNEMDQLKAANQKLTNDLQMRLQDLEAKNAGAVAAPMAATPTPPMYGPTTNAPTTPATTTAPTSSSQPGVLGTLPAQGTTPPVGTPEKQYEAAYNLFTQTDYAGAERGFRSFLANNPKHPLAANASYWLGDTYYLRNQMDQAATAFAESFQKYPHGPKAPDSLLKLAMSMGRQGKTQEACLSLGELDKQFPAAAPKIKTAAAQERTRYKCP